MSFKHELYLCFYSFQALKTECAEFLVDLGIKGRAIRICIRERESPTSPLTLTLLRNIPAPLLLPRNITEQVLAEILENLSVEVLLPPRLLLSGTLPHALRQPICRIGLLNSDPFTNPHPVQISRTLWASRFRTHSAVADRFVARFGPDNTAKDSTSDAENGGPILL